MIISPGRNPTTHPSVISLQGEPLNFVTETRLLGIQVDNCLSWTKHIDVIVRKVSQKVGVLRRTFRQLSKLARRQYILSVVLPDILYCICSFVTLITAKDHNRLVSVYNRAIRAACGASSRDSISGLLKNLDVKPLDYYFLVSTGKFIFINHILRPLPVFTSLFPAPQSTRSTRNRDTHDIPYLKCRTTLGQKSFVLRAALFFNALPNDLKSSLFTSQFDRGFKRLLDDPVWFERYRAILFDNVGNV